MIVFHSMRVVLAQRSMTQKQLAEMTHIRPPTISAICCGKIKEVPVEVLDKICRVLECQPGDLMKYEPDVS